MTSGSRQYQGYPLKPPVAVKEREGFVLAPLAPPAPPGQPPSINTSYQYPDGPQSNWEPTSFGDTFRTFFILALWAIGALILIFGVAYFGQDARPSNSDWLPLSRPLPR